MSGWTHTRFDINPGLGFDRWRLSGPAEGPRVVVLGGVHGDETEGQLAAGTLTTLDLELQAGIIDVVPVCNEGASAADSRTTPADGLNLARVFPGDESGSPTQRLAARLTRDVLAGADLLIDLHTSGRSYDMPFLAGFRRDAQLDPTGLGERAAMAIGADFVWHHPHRAAGRTLSVVDVGIYLESPDRGSTDMDTVNRYVDGVLRVLAVAGVLRSPVPALRADAPIRVHGGGDLDQDLTSVQVPGLFIRSVSEGDAVVRGALLGVVVDRRGRTVQELRAEEDGWVMALKRRSRVDVGDSVALLASADHAAAASAGAGGRIARDPRERGDARSHPDRA
jgi:predicted deacylase